MKHKISITLVVLTLFLLTAVIAKQFLFKTSATRSMTTAIAEQLPAGDFTLDSLDGKVSLSDFKDKVVLLYFGYTFCPDMCPTSLAFMGQAIAQLEGSEKQQVQGIFVSVDPKRDTLKQLKEYSQKFSDKIVGLTGTKLEVDAIVGRYAVAYELLGKDKKGHYEVDHSSATLLIGKDGKLKDLLPHGLPSKKIIERVREYL
ncbi:MAG TPA: SCO family protein [Leucothrix mucor]|nr:SCO family protein [Leucothrix mucor]